MKAVVNFNVQNLRIIVINQETNKNLKPILRVTLGIKIKFRQSNHQANHQIALIYFGKFSGEPKLSQIQTFGKKKRIRIKQNLGVPKHNVEKFQILIKIRKIWG